MQPSILSRGLPVTTTRYIGRLYDSLAARRMLKMMFCVSFSVGLLVCFPLTLPAQTKVMRITKRYLNLPVARGAKFRLFTLRTDKSITREFPVQLAEDKVDYWIYIDVGDLKGHTITLNAPAPQSALNRIYQADTIRGQSTLYKESGRPQFHFTVKRGWSNDVNGPIFYKGQYHHKGQYHLFWQAFPFGVVWDTGYMYWGHAVSKDLIHWQELPPALTLDKLGSPWSGTALIDHRNIGGWGKDALVLIYTAFDRFTKKEVQCIAYSTDDGVTFQRYGGNPVLDTNRELGTAQTRDPKVFWYAPTHHWVMVLFEKDGMSFLTSSTLKIWTRKSHVKGLFECPDFFELPIDGDAARTKWVLHGGSSTYFIGTFDGETFTPESSSLHYAEGKNVKGDDILYAAQSFAEMPDSRRVQMAWGRIEQKGMPFNQLMLFPTEFRLVTTADGLRMRATPIREIGELHQKKHTWSSVSIADANEKLQHLPAGPLQVKIQTDIGPHDAFTIRYNGNDLVTLTAHDLNGGRCSVEALIDKSVAEVFVNQGSRYIIRELSTSSLRQGLSLSVEGAAQRLDHLDVYEMKSMWRQ
jgi:fructan beta-fructosidase